MRDLHRYFLLLVVSVALFGAASSLNVTYPTPLPFAGTTTPAVCASGADTYSNLFAEVQLPLVTQVQKFVLSASRLTLCDVRCVPRVLLWSISSTASQPVVFADAASHLVLKSFDPSVVNAIFGLTLVDPDGDGLKDVVISYSMSGQYLFAQLVNNGSALVKDLTQSSPIGSPHAVVGADVTGDSRDELIQVGRSAAYTLFPRTNGSYHSGFVISALPVVLPLEPVSGGVTVIDASGDGIKDVFFCMSPPAYSDSSLQYCNILVSLGNGSFSSRPDLVIGLRNMSHTRMTVRDLNVDGMDELIAFGGGGPAIYSANGSSLVYLAQPSALLASASILKAYGVFTGKSSGLVDFDILATGYTGSSDTYEYFVSSGGMNYSRVTAPSDLPVLDGSVQTDCVLFGSAVWSDLAYQDGVDDLLFSAVCRSGTSSVVYFAAGQGSNTPRFKDLTDILPKESASLKYASADVGDINGDGCDDFLIIGQSALYGPVTKMYAGHCNGSLSILDITVYPLDDVQGGVVATFQRSGKRPIIYVSGETITGSQQCRLLEYNTASQQYVDACDSSCGIGIIGSGAIPYTQILRGQFFGNDGIEDVIVFDLNYLHSTTAYRGENSVPCYYFTNVTGTLLSNYPYYNHAAAAVVDANADGLDDLAFDYSVGFLVLRINQGNGTFAATSTNATLSSAVYFMRSANLFGNLSSDLVLCTGIRVVLLRGNPNSSFSDVSSLLPTGGSKVNSAIRYGSIGVNYGVTNTSRLDIFIIGEIVNAPSFLVLRQLLNFSIVDISLGYFPSTFTGSSNSDVLYGHFDADSILDIVIAGGMCPGATVFLSTIPPLAPNVTNPSSTTTSGVSGDLTGGLASDDSTGAIVGAVVGGVGGLALILLCGLCVVVCCILLVLTVLLVLLLVLVALIVLVTLVAALLGGGGGSAGAFYLAGSGRSGGGSGDAFMLDARTDDLDELNKLLSGTSSFRVVSVQDIKLGRRLAAGAFGSVYEGEWAGVAVAVKIMDLNENYREVIEEFRNEAVLMAKVSHHPNILRFIGAAHTNEKLYIMTELCPHGALTSMLEKGLLDDGQKLRLATDAAGGVAFLHHVGVVHRDIAARNVLVSEGYRALVADFGLARMVDIRERGGAGAATTKSNIGPVRWMAPECLQSKEYSEASDVYAFAMLLWEMWHPGQVPFHDQSIVDVMMRVLQADARPPIDDGRMPTAVASMLPWMWARRPEDRSTMQDVFSALRDLSSSYDAVGPDALLGTPSLRHAHDSAQSLMSASSTSSMPTYANMVPAPPMLKDRSSTSGSIVISEYVNTEA